MVDVGGRYNAVAFANVTLLFGMMSLLSLGWGASTRWPRIETAVKVLVALLSVYATWVSETRSSWMLLPILALVFLVGLRTASRRRKLYCALGLAVALVISAAAIWNFSSRMHVDHQTHSVLYEKNFYNARLILYSLSIVF